MKFSLELYIAPDNRTPLAHFKSDAPFSVAVGQYVNDQFLREDGRSTDPLLRIVRVVHVLGNERGTNDLGGHHINVYCEREPA